MLRAEGTFSFNDNRDGIARPAAEGRWRLDEEGFLVAETPREAPPPLHEEVRKAKSLTFCVADEVTGAAVAGAGVDFEAEGIASHVNTDAAGCVELPRYKAVSSITVGHCDYETASYTPSKLEANVFRIRLRHPRPSVANEKWLLRNGKLLRLADPPLLPSQKGQPNMRIHYVEIVCRDVAAQCAALERLHGLSFGPPVADLGQARVAQAPDGSLIGVRAPLASHEEPIIRTYLEVEDIAKAVKEAEAAGAVIAYPPTKQGDTGTWAIYFLGEVQIGLWQR